MRTLTKVLFGFALLGVLSVGGCSGAHDPTAPSVRPQTDENPACISVGGRWYCN